MENTRLRAEIDQLEVTHLCQIHVGDSWKKYYVLLYIFWVTIANFLHNTPKTLVTGAYPTTVAFICNYTSSFVFL
jgi:hypothetical protein